MKTESISKLFALVAVIGVAGFAPTTAKADDTPLGKEMDAISASLKGLRKLKREDDRWTASAALIREGQAACIRSMALVPKEIEDLEDGVAKTKAISDNKRLMGLVLAALCELEVAHLEEDEDKIEEVTDKLKDLKKEGHEKYYTDE